MSAKKEWNYEAPHTKAVLSWALIEAEEIGGIKDNDQYFLQMLGGKTGDGRSVADFSVMDYRGTEIFRVSLCLFGEQRISYVEGEEGTPLPYAEEGTEVRLIDEPEKWLELRRLERESGERYLNYSDSCWIEPRYFVSLSGRNGPAEVFEIQKIIDRYLKDKDAFDLQGAILQLQAEEEAVLGSISEYALSSDEAYEIGRLAEYIQMCWQEEGKVKLRATGSY